MLRGFLKKFVAILVLLGCQPNQEEVSGLKEFTSAYLGTNDPELLKRIYQKRPFDIWIESKLKEADAAALTAKTALENEARARDVSLTQFLNDLNLSQYGKCLADKPANQCAGLSNIPPEAVLWTTVAIRNYTQILNLLAGEQRSEAEFDKILDDNCKGFLEEGERQLCEEIYLMSDLYEEAYKELYIYYYGVDPTPEDLQSDGPIPNQQFPADAVQPDQKAFQNYILYNNLAEDIRQKLMNYRLNVSNKLLQLSQGQLDNTPPYIVPYLAVVGKPDVFVDWIKKYSGKLEEQSRLLIQKKKEILELKKQAASASITKSQFENEFNDIKSQVKGGLGNCTGTSSGGDCGGILGVEKESIAVEDKHFLKEVEAIQAQIANTQTKFSLEMRSVLGASDEVQLLNTKRVNLIPNSLAEAFPTVQIGKGFDGIIDIEASTTRKLRANGVYAGDDPKTYYSWLSKAAKSAESFVKKKVVPVLKKCAQNFSGFGPSNTECVDAVAEYGLGVDKKAGDKLPLYDLSVETAKNQETIDAFMQSDNPGQLVAARTFLKIETNSVPPEATARTLINQLQGVPEPTINTHVYNAETDLEGYLISSSKGVSSSLTEGTSTSLSKSINTSVGTSKGYSNSKSAGGGSSAGVSFFASYGVSQSSGNGTSESVGFSETVSKGESSSTTDSNSTSVGKNSGLSIQVGYYHPKSVYPNLRLGMLVGEVYCQPSPGVGNFQPDGSRLMGIYAIGTKNFIKVESSKLRMRDGSMCDSEMTLRLVINDDLTSTHKKCGLRDCNSGDGMPIEAKIFVDTAATYRKLLSVFGSDEFKQTLRDAAYSSDPLNSSRALFRQMANRSGPIDESTLDRFMRVVDTYVTLELDRKKLEDLAMKRAQLKLNADKIEIKRNALLSNLDYVSANLQQQGNVLNYGDILVSATQGEYEIVESQVLYYLHRLNYWIGIYEKSNRYHNRRSSQIDVEDFIKRRFLKLLDRADSTSKVDTIDADLAALNLASTLSQYVDGAEELKFVQSLVESDQVSHCYVSLNEILDIQTRKSNSSVSEIIKAENLIKFSTGNATVSDPGLQNSVKDALKGTLASGYRPFSFRTDPVLAASNWDDPRKDPALLEKASTTQADAPLHCYDAPQVYMGKILGVGFTYTKKQITGSISQPFPVQLYMSRSPLIWSYLESLPEVKMNYDRFYSYIDYTSLTSTWNWNRELSLIKSVPMIDEDNLMTACRYENNQDNWRSPECAKKILGENLLSARRGDLVNVSFYNQFIGGDWNIYFPENSSYTDAMLNRIDQLKMHIFFVATVNP